MANLQEQQQEAKRRRVKQLEKEAANQKATAATDLTTVTTEPPKSLQDNGQNKLSKYLLKYTVDYILTNLPTVISLLDQLGIPNVDEAVTLYETNKVEYDKKIQSLVCPNQEALLRILEVRNEINKQLTLLGKSYTLVSNGLNNLNIFLAGQIDSLAAIKTARSITSQVVKIIPSPPGTPGLVTSLLSDTQDVLNTLTFTLLGSPKLQDIKSTVDLGLMLTSQGAGMMKNFLNRFTIVDDLLKKCGQVLEPVDPAIADYVLLNSNPQPATDSVTKGNYKGFTLEIQTEEFSQNLTRKKAVAYNAFGIIVLETALSFTTTPQVLMDQLRFEIDSKNLKAD